MPIIWKTSFEDPLIQLTKAGKIQLVDSIATFYDASVRTGLAQAPGTPAGPLINGNIVAFKQFLNAYYKINNPKTVTKTALIYASLIKSILSKIKFIQSEIKNSSSNISNLDKNITSLRSEINILEGTADINSKKSILNKQTELNANLASKQYETTKISKLKSKITTEIQPKIKKIKSDLVSLSKKILLPASQDTSLSMFKQLPNSIKTLGLEIKEKKSEYNIEIKSKTSIITNAASEIVKISAATSKSDQTELKILLNNIIKSTSESGTIKNSIGIVGIINKYPDTKIPRNLKDSCRSNLNKIAAAKRDIIKLKDKINTKLREIFKVKKDQLTKTFTPKRSTISKISEKKADALEIKNAILSIKNAISPAVLSTLILNEIKNERIKTRDQSVKYVHNTKLSTLLNKYSPNMGDRYLEINSNKNVNTYILALLSQFSNINSKLKLNKEKAKSYLVEIRTKIKNKQINKNEIQFNNFLRLALTAYWTGGMMPNLGIVAYPGLVSLPVPMKMTADPTTFIKNLSKTFQAHIKTVTGTYTTSTTPPVVLPWVGFM